MKNNTLMNTLFVALLVLSTASFADSSNQQIESKIKRLHVEITNIKTKQNKISLALSRLSPLEKSAFKNEVRLTRRGHR